MTVRIAALLTTHNRAATTLSCLAALAAQQLDGAHLDTIICDAASSDGTREFIRKDYPAAVILEASDRVYWNGGMLQAFTYALDRDYDFYLWVNDDTILDDDAVLRLLETYSAQGGSTIVVGAIRDPDNGSATYGGVQRTSRLRPLRFEVMPFREEPVQAETMNGNCVLISRGTVRRVGLLDPRFTHSMGDFDYGLRAGAAGVRIWVAPGSVGICPRNPQIFPPASLRRFMDHLTGPKGLPPLEWAHFARRWAGPAWPIYAASPYVRRTLAWATRPRRLAAEKR